MTPGQSPQIAKLRTALAVVALAAVGGCVSSRAGATLAWPESLAGAAHEITASSPVPAHVRLGGHFGERTGRSGERTFHAGLDFAAPTGTEIFAVAPGIVTIVTHDDDAYTRLAGYGNAIVVHHPALGVWTMYAHLSEVTVAEGDAVVAGTSMGRTGGTNNHRFRGMGAHLHFEVRRVRADGTDPFPGTYGRHNLDPEDWLASLGIVYGRHGVLDTGAETVALGNDETSVEPLDGAWLVTHEHSDVAIATAALGH